MVAFTVEVAVANSKARCKGCKTYRPRAELDTVGLSSVCTDNPECRRSVLNATKAATTRKVERVRKRKRPSLSPALRRGIRARDVTCRFCGQIAGRMEVHHIEYRSQGGKDSRGNLILLCEEHHRLAHSKKWYWQPILRAYIWLYYAEGKKNWTIDRVERELEARDALPTRV